MIPKERIARIVRELLEKTAAKKIPWEGTDSPRGPTIYSVALPNAEIQVSYESPATEPDYVSIKFNRTDGRTIGFLRIDEDDEFWRTAKRLYDEIDHIVSRWDEVLDDVERYLATK